MSKYFIIGYWKRRARRGDCCSPCSSTCLSSLCCLRGCTWSSRATWSTGWSCWNHSLCYTSSRLWASRSRGKSSRGPSRTWRSSTWAHPASWGSFISRGSYIGGNVPSRFLFLEIVVELLLYFLEVAVFLLFLLKLLLEVLLLFLVERVGLAVGALAEVFRFLEVACYALLVLLKLADLSLLGLYGVLHCLRLVTEFLVGAFELGLELLYWVLVLSLFFGPSLLILLAKGCVFLLGFGIVLLDEVFVVILIVGDLPL